jgi:imidazolonepropionase-like amidohydrolase
MHAISVSSTADPYDDRTSRVVPQVLIRNGRIAAVGNNVVRRGGGLTVVDLKGRTVIPGIIDAHNHIVLVGNRPGGTRPSSTSSPFPRRSRL